MFSSAADLPKPARRTKLDISTPATQVSSCSFSAAGWQTCRPAGRGVACTTRMEVASIPLPQLALLDQSNGACRHPQLNPCIIATAGHSNPTSQHHRHNLPGPQRSPRIPQPMLTNHKPLMYEAGGGLRNPAHNIARFAGRLLAWPGFYIAGGEMHQDLAHRLNNSSSSSSSRGFCTIHRRHRDMSVRRIYAGVQIVYSSPTPTYILSSNPPRSPVAE